MFALRKIIGNAQTNYALGVQYQVVERFVDYEDFSHTFKQEFGYDHVADLDDNADNYTKNCYAFLITPDFKAIPLYMNQKNYIMTETGKTFSNLTFK